MLRFWTIKSAVSSRHRCGETFTSETWLSVFRLAAAFSISAAIALVLCGCGGRETQQIRAESSFAFESGAMGWKPETTGDSRAVVNVAQSADAARAGVSSLRLTINLRGGDARLGKGETYVDIRICDMTAERVSAWVYCPAGAVGDPQKPNGIQLFVKDYVGKSEYGSWTNMAPDTWQEILLYPSTVKPVDGWMDAGFDPSKVVRVGIKVAVGGGSTWTYSGPIYVDSVAWTSH